MIPELVVTEEQTEVLVKLFSSPRGQEAKEFFQNIAESISFHEDPYVTAFNEGRRQLAVWLYSVAIASKVVSTDHLDFNDSDNTRG